MKHLILILFLCLALVAFFGCKKEEAVVEEEEVAEVEELSDENLIKDVADKYFQALITKDVDAYKAVLTEESLATFDEAQEEAWLADLEKNVVNECSYKEAKIDGHTASLIFMAKVTKASAVAEEPRMVELAKVEDAWKMVFKPKK